MKYNSGVDLIPLKVEWNISGHCNPNDVLMKKVEIEKKTNEDGRQSTSGAAAVSDISY